MDGVVVFRNCGWICFAGDRPYRDRRQALADWNPGSNRTGFRVPRLHRVPRKKAGSVIRFSGYSHSGQLTISFYG